MFNEEFVFGLTSLSATKAGSTQGSYSYSELADLSNGSFESVDVLRAGGAITAALGAITLLCALPALIITAVGIFGKGPGAANGPCCSQERCCSGMCLHIACSILTVFCTATWVGCFYGSICSNTGTCYEGSCSCTDILDITLGPSYYLCGVS